MVFFIGIIISIIAFIVSLCLQHFKVGNSGILKSIQVFAVACIFIFVAISAILYIKADAEANTITELNYELTLYQQPVENAFNEYVRFDFYNRVQTHNELLLNYQKASETFLLRDFYKIEKLNGCRKINFSLRVDEPQSIVG